MLEPSRFALTRTPSMAPSAVDVTRPVRAGATPCAGVRNPTDRPRIIEAAIPTRYVRLIVIKPPGCELRGFGVRLKCRQDNSSVFATPNRKGTTVGFGLWHRFDG